MNLYQKFEALALAEPSAPALIYEGKILSRKMLMAHVDGLAAGLFSKGVKPTDVVGINLANTPIHLMSLLAVARLGAASLPLHPRSAPPVRRRLISKYKATYVLVEKIPANADVIKSIQFLQVDEILRLGQSGFEAKALPVQPDALSIGRISLTSGTSGEPSAIAYTHENWISRLVRTSVGYDRNTRLLVGSLHLTLGNILAFAALLAGGVVIFSPTKGSGNLFFDTIQMYGVTHASMVPSGVKGLASIAPKNGIALPTIQQLRIVGGAMSDHIFNLAYSKLTPNLVLPYGTSEVGLITMATTQMLMDHPDHVGLAIPGVEIEVVDADDRVLGPNTLGELRVRASAMSSEYFLDETRTREKFRNGWFYTSDIGKITPEGFVKIEGRSDDRINIAGVKLFPEQVERVLNSHPRIKESAVFTIPDEKFGKKMVAALVMEGAYTIGAEELFAFCQSRKLAEKIPAEYFICQELTRNLSGKLVRSELTNLLNERAVMHPLRIEK